MLRNDNFLQESNIQFVGLYNRQILLRLLRNPFFLKLDLVLEIHLRHVETAKILKRNTQILLKVEIGLFNLLHLHLEINDTDLISLIFHAEIGDVFESLQSFIVVGNGINIH